MRSVALDLGDKRLAAIVWGGLFSGGPLLPIAIFIVTRSRAGSLAKRHAVAAFLMWLLLPSVWLPAVLYQVFIARGNPGVWFIALAGAIMLTILTCSVVGFVLAVRAPIAPQSNPSSTGVSRH